MFTDDLIRRALEEDIGGGDITTDAIVPADLQGSGTIIAKEPLVLAGLGVAGGVFLTLDPSVRFRQMFPDGSRVSEGTVVFEVSGPYRSLLKGERVALNFLQRLCGIATLTRKFVDQVGSRKTRILDTRKTAPLLRHLEKYAVRMGGGTNHRSGLYDAILIKDNHLAACRGDLVQAISKARQANPTKPVVVEVTSPDQVKAAVQSGANRLLLDNMSNEEVRTSMSIGGSVVAYEVSGGVTLERVDQLAGLGVDFISVGALTHSARSCDLSFEILPQ